MKRQTDRWHPTFDRRTFLVLGGLGLLGLSSLGGSPPRRATAKSTILIWLSGGASHVDTWDMKPDAPAEYRGLFRPVATSAPGVMLCEHLPHLRSEERRVGNECSMRG